MLTTEALTRAVAALPYPSIEDTHKDRHAHAEAVAAYRARERALRDEWQAWLAAEYLPTNLTQAQTDAVFAKAWEDGHAEGYRSVEHAYENLSDFVIKILKG